MSVSPPTETQSLEKASAPALIPKVIKTPEQFRSARRQWEAQGFNVLSAFTNISGLIPYHGIVFNLVLLEQDKALGEVYDGLPFLKSGEVALAKNGLRKLAENAGISTHTIRTDDRATPYYWEFQAVASYRSVDGATITREATMEWDLRDGAPRLKGWTQNQVEEGRKHGLRNCEARAINAAIRECGVGVRQKYTREELKKPFVVVRVAFDPDMTDAETRRIVTERALSGTAALYAPRERGHHAPPQMLEEPVDDRGSMSSDEPRHVGRGSTVTARPDGSGVSAPAPPPPGPPAPDVIAPPFPNAVRLAKINEVTGKSASGRKWTKWVVIDSNGVEHSTFSRTMKQAIEQFIAAETWVEIDEEQSEDGRFTNLVNITAGPVPRQVDLNDDESA